MTCTRFDVTAGLVGGAYAVGRARSLGRGVEVVTGGDAGVADVQDSASSTNSAPA